MPSQSKKLLDQVRDVLRLKHYSIRTEEAYGNWIRRFILFHDKRHPKEMGASEIEAFLTYLAVDQKVAASTQNQALSALLFLYRDVLEQDLSGDAIDAVRARQPKRMPTVLSREETLSVIAALSGTNQLIARLLYGSGLRLLECLRLRVKDLDFAYHQITGSSAVDRGHEHHRATSALVALEGRPLRLGGVQGGIGVWKESRSSTVQR